MDAVSSFFSWLFGTRQGVLALVVGGIILFLIIAFVLERKTRMKYKEHAKSPDDWSLFDDDDDDKDAAAKKGSSK
jgi:hypothetical protein